MRVTWEFFFGIITQVLPFDKLRIIGKRVFRWFLVFDTLPVRFHIRGFETCQKNPCLIALLGYWLYAKFGECSVEL